MGPLRLLALVLGVGGVNVTTTTETQTTTTFVTSTTTATVTNTTGTTTVTSVTTVVTSTTGSTTTDSVTVTGTTTSTSSTVTSTTGTSTTGTSTTGTSTTGTSTTRTSITWTGTSTSTLSSTTTSKTSTSSSTVTYQRPVEAAERAKELPQCKPEILFAVQSDLFTEVLRYALIGEDLDCTDVSGQLFIFSALERCPDDVLSSVVDSYSTVSPSLFARNSAGSTPLLLAAGRGLSATTRTLLRLGANRAAVDDQGRTLLHSSAAALLMPVLQSLPPEMVSQQLASQDSSGNTPLHLALKAQKVDEVQQALAFAEQASGLAPALLQQLVLTENQLGEQLVHLNSGRQLLEELLLLGANFSARTALGALPLHTVAGLSDASQTLELLARYSEDVASARDSRGRFCAHYAAAAGASGNLRWLREQGADLRARDYELLLPLELAFAGGHFDLVPVFAGDFPLEAAAGSGNVSLVQQLVLDGYSPHEVDERARTAIFEALEKDRVDVAQFLASQNASLTLLDVSGLSPLAAAVRFQRSASLEFLVAQNVPVTQRLANASTALHLAAAGGREIIDLLVRAGADVNAVDMLNRSALHFCTNAGAVEALLAANASHLPSLRGLLPLHVAAVEGRVEALEALLASRTTQVDAVDFSGNTPLHLAVAAGQAPAAQVLLRWCASALTLNQDGQAPVQLARTVQMQDVLDQPAERCQCDCGSLRFDPLMVTGTWQSCSTTVRCRFGGDTMTTSCVRTSAALGSTATGAWSDVGLQCRAVSGSWQVRLLPSFLLLFLLT